MISSHELHNLAVLWRSNSFNLGHVSTWDAMSRAGLAFSHGLYLGTPRHFKRKRAALRISISEKLEALAAKRYHRR